MNELSKQTKRPTTTMPPIAARLDLTNEGQRRLHDLIKRFHTGRWPLFRCLGMRNVNGSLVEAVEWLRTSPPRYSVIYWQNDGFGLYWCAAKGNNSAMHMLRCISEAR